MIAAGEVTTLLVEILALATEGEDCPFPGVLIGDGVAPDEAGWATGQPNASDFVPYLVVKPTGSVATVASTPLSESVGVFFPITYSLTAYHYSRVNADVLAAWSRDAFLADNGTHDIGDLTVKMRQAAIDSLALASRDDSTYPKLWSSVTNVHVNAARVPASK